MIKLAALNVTDGISNQLVGILNDGQTAADSAFASVLNIDTTRSTVIGIVFGVSLVLCVVLVIFLIFRAPQFMKRTTALSGFKWFIFFILGLIFMLLAVVSGEACGALFDNNGTGLSVLLNQYLSSTVNISAALDAKKQCRDGESLLTVVSNLHIFNGFSADSFNFTSQLNSVLDEASIGNAIGQVNTTGALPFDFIQTIRDSFTATLRDQVSNDLTALANSAFFDGATFPIVAPTQLAALTVFRDSLIAFAAGLTGAEFTYVGAVAGARQANAVTTYRALCTAAINSMNSLLLTPGTSSLAVLEAQRTTIKSSILSLQGFVYNTLVGLFHFSIRVCWILFWHFLNQGEKYTH